MKNPETARLSNQHLLAYALIALGAITLLARLGGADWLWLALLSVAFLLGYVSRKNYGFLVAGGVLMGVAVGTLIGTQSGMLLGLAGGFFAIDRVHPRANRWALYAAGIFAVLGGLSALSATGLLGSVGFALALIAFGSYLLLRDREVSRFPPQESYTPTHTSPSASQVETPVPAPTMTAPSAPVNASTRAEAEDHAAPPPTVRATPDTAQGVTAVTVAAPEAGAPTRGEAQPSGPEAAPNSPPTPTGPELGPEASARLRRLEAWRRETASAEGTPAYIVFSNDTLARIAAAAPRTLTEMGAIKGVGPVKLERYGESVLEIVRGDLMVGQTG